MISSTADHHCVTCFFATPKWMAVINMPFPCDVVKFFETDTVWEREILYDDNMIVCVVAGVLSTRCCESTINSEWR